MCRAGTGHPAAAAISAGPSAVQHSLSDLTNPNSFFADHPEYEYVDGEWEWLGPIDTDDERN